MTFQEWLQQFYPDYSEDMMEDLMNEYLVWQRIHTKAKCTYCQTGELPDDSDLKGIL